MDKIRPGIYRHFKGGTYLVFGEEKHSETGEIFVSYMPLYGNYERLTRPKSMWFEEVDRPDFNYKGPRFTLIRAV